MAEYDLRDVVPVHLYRHGGDGDGAAPYEASVRGIGEALGIPAGSMSERIGLLSVLSELESDGLVEERRRPVGGLEGRHSAYELTDDGRTEAAALLDRVRDREIVVVEGGRRAETTVGDAGEHLPEYPVVRALSGVTEDGVVHLESGDADGFVDRTAETDRLEEHASAVADGATRSVAVVGEAGVGKTAVLTELEATLRDRDVAVLSGRCSSDVTTPYAPVGTALSDAGVALEKLQLFGADRDERPPAAGDDPSAFEAQRRASFDEVASALSGLADERPVALFLDDVHWIDEASLSLLEFLGEEVTVPALFVVSYRPDDLDADGGPSDRLRSLVVDRVELDRFDRAATRRLVERRIGKAGLPESFVERIHEHTGGNPLFVEESVERLLEDGVVDPRHEYYPTDPDEIPIPDRVQAAIDDRLATLDDAGRAVLERGSVLGDAFGVDALVATCEHSRSTVAEYVNVLVDGRVWERDGDRVRFRTAVVRETVLEGVDPGRRRRLHVEAAEALRSVREDPDPERVADHYERAGEYERAMDQYVEAGNDACAVYAHEVALEHFQRALSLAREELDLPDDDPTVLSTLEAIADIHRTYGNTDEAAKYFEYVTERASEPERRRSSYADWSNMRVNVGDYGRALELAETGLAIGDEDPATPGDCELLSAKGWALKQQGDVEAAIDAFETELDLAGEVGEDRHVANAYQDLGSAVRAAGELERAVDLLTEAAEHFDDDRDRRQLGTVHNSIAGVHWRLGDLDATEESFRRALELFREVGYQVGVAKLLTNVGLVLDKRGEIDRALEYYRDGLAASRRLGDRQNVAVALGNLGNVRRLQGDLDLARDRFEEGLEIERDLGNDPHVVVFTLNLARTDRMEADFDRARERAERALDLAREVGVPDMAADAGTLLGNLERDVGRLEAAIDHHEEAASVAADAGNVNEEAPARAGLALDYVEAGRVEDALEAAEAALELADASDERMVDVRANRALGVALRADGQQSAARERLETALAAARDVQSTVHEGRILYEIGTLAADRGNDREAASVLGAARELAAEMDSSRLADRLEDALVDLPDPETVADDAHGSGEVITD